MNFMYLMYFTYSKPTPKNINNPENKASVLDSYKIFSDFSVP